MILVTCLLVVVGGLLVVGPPLLRALTASGRQPLSGILAWQLTSWSVVVSAGLALAVIASPSLAAADQMPPALESCLQSVRRVLNPRDSALVRVAAAVLLTGVVVRLVIVATRAGMTNHRRRARHRLLLSLVGRPDPDLDAHVVEDRAAVAYCLPGRGGRVVFTSAAMSRLTVAQRRAVLAHEHAHLHGRHHLFVASAALLDVAFPRVRLFRAGRQHTARLVEMRADDVAVRGHGRRPVADALLALADVVSPAGVLAATGVTTAVRIERLLSTPTRMPRSRRLSVVQSASFPVAAGLVAVSPVLLAVGGHAALCLI